MTFPIIPASTVNGAYQISRSLRLRNAATAYLTRTPASTGSQTTYTFSFWIKRGALGTGQLIFHSGASGTTYAFIGFGVFSDATTADTLGFEFYSSNVLQGGLVTTQIFRDPSAWYHIVAVADTTNATSGDRLRLYVNGSRITAFTTQTYPAQNTALTSWNVASSVQAIGRKNDTATLYLDGYLAEVNFIDGQALTPSSFGAFDTNGVWQPARYTGSYGTNGFYLPFTNNSATTASNLTTYSEQFDNAAWSKVGTSITANALTAPNSTTTADKLVESSTTGNHYTRQVLTVTSGVSVTISVYAKAGENNYIGLICGYASKGKFFNLSSGTIGNNFNSAPTDASITSVGNGWYRCSVTATTTGTTESIEVYNSRDGSTINYNGDGSSGVYLWGAQLQQSSSLGAYYVTTSSAQSSTLQIGTDASISTGGYNNWVSNNISVTSGTTYDSMIDSPTNYADGGNGRGNYPTLNPLNPATRTITEGNLRATGITTNNHMATATMIISGKTYWEATDLSSPVSSWGNFSIGICQASLPATTSWFGAGAICVRDYEGNFYRNGTLNPAGVSAPYGAGVTNDVYMLAYDPATTSLWIGRNGTWFNSGNPASGTGAISTVNLGDVVPFIGVSQSGDTGCINFGQRPFAYTPPSGFSALNTQNLPTPTIAAGNKYFDATVYTGTAATQNIVNSGSFQPDLVWTKRRSVSNSHQIFDAIRGVTNSLQSDTTNGDTTTQGALTSFNNNGFTVPNNAYVNSSPDTFIGWQWKGGNGTVSNTSGSITSTVSANTSAGFSVVTYTGTGANATVGHGLGVAPSMIIVKCRSAATNWAVYHSGLTSAAYFLKLNLTDAQVSAATIWNSTAPTSTVFSIGNSGAVNNSSSDTYVAYCFAPVAGYSAFGSYTGNGSADGPFVYTGFRPRWVLIKRTDLAGHNWILVDSARSAYNLQLAGLYADLTNSEASGADGAVDLLSNGFKIRTNSAANLNSSGTYIYAAFAENPFKNSRAR